MDKLKQLLDSGEEITVMCNKCGHVFPLTDVEVKNTRAAVAAGILG
jgi:uncharacterized Zn finger protein